MTIKLLGKRLLVKIKKSTSNLNDLGIYTINTKKEKDIKTASVVLLSEEAAAELPFLKPRSVVYFLSLDGNRFDESMDDFVDNNLYESMDDFSYEFYIVETSGIIGYSNIKKW